jgi:hypothetical protein
MNKQMQKTIEPEAQQVKTRRSKPDRRWTLLFIGDHGRVITLKRFKGIVFLTGLVFVFSVASIILLYWYNESINRKNEKLESSLDLFQKRIQTLRHEKEILMARLVLAESRVKESIDTAPETETPKPGSIDEQNEPSQKESIEVAAKEKKTPVATAPVAPQPAAEPSDNNFSVNAEDFDILKLPDPKKIKIQFRIRNTSPNSRRVTGHAMVVLKGDDLKPEMWLAVPTIGLVDGKPTGKQRGQKFSINNWRTMRFTTSIPQRPLEYNRAVVYVYSGKGQLLLEEEFPAQIPVSAAPVPEASQGDGTLHTLKVGDSNQKSENQQTEIQTSESKDPLLLY